MAVVKADAYGHGMAAVVPQLLSLGVRSFAAATLDEGSQLRALGAEGTVLILGYTSPQRAGELARLGLTQTVADLAHAEALNAQGVPLRVHLKIDTGMHRLGIAWDAPEAVSAVFRMENLTVDGIYSHLCCADPPVLCADGGACRAGHFPAEAASAKQLWSPELSGAALRLCARRPCALWRGGGNRSALARSASRSLAPGARRLRSGCGEGRERRV